MGAVCGILMNDEDAHDKLEAKQFQETRRPRAQQPELRFGPQDRPEYGPTAIYGPSDAYSVATELSTLPQTKPRSRSRSASRSRHTSAPLRQTHGVHNSVVRERGPSNASNLDRPPPYSSSQYRQASPLQRNDREPNDFRGRNRAYPHSTVFYEDGFNSPGTIPLPRSTQSLNYNPRTRHLSDTSSRSRLSQPQSKMRYSSVPTEAPPLTAKDIVEQDFRDECGETPGAAANRRARTRTQQLALAGAAGHILSAVISAV